MERTHSWVSQNALWYKDNSWYLISNSWEDLFYLVVCFGLASIPASHFYQRGTKEEPLPRGIGADAEKMKKKVLDSWLACRMWSLWMCGWASSIRAVGIKWDNNNRVFILPLVSSQKIVLNIAKNSRGRMSRHLFGQVTPDHEDILIFSHLKWRNSKIEIARHQSEEIEGSSVVDAKNS